VREGLLDALAIVSDRYLHQMIAKNLLSYRQERGISQQAFAVMLAVDRSYVGELERGEHNLTLAGVERLARRLDISVLDLLTPCARMAGTESKSS